MKYFMHYSPYQITSIFYVLYNNLFHFDFETTVPTPDMIRTRQYRPTRIPDRAGGRHETKRGCPAMTTSGGHGSLPGLYTRGLGEAPSHLGFANPTEKKLPVLELGNFPDVPDNSAVSFTFPPPKLAGGGSTTVREGVCRTKKVSLPSNRRPTRLKVRLIQYWKMFLIT